MALPKLSTGALNIYADPLLGSATSPTTSPEHSSKQEDSDPNYTLNYEEPLTHACVGRAVGINDVLIGTPSDLECDVLLTGKQVE